METMSTLWEEYKARLRGYVAKRVDDRDAVEDILQDVFLKAHQNLPDLKARDRVAAWLFRIASNAIADHYRQRQRWVDLPLDLESPQPEPDRIADLADCLHPLIADLPETYRTALILSEIEGLPQSEVAHRLGLSVSGAKSRVQRGRAQLLERLNACCLIESRRRGTLEFEPRDKNCSEQCR